MSGLATKTVPIEVTIFNAQPAGRVMCRAFGDADSFSKRERPVLQFSLDPGGAANVRSTVALPPGRYAIAVFQDTRGTGRLETNFLGTPTVPYGFSNDAKGSFGPPNFEAAAFDVRAAPVKLAIHLR